MQGGGGHSGRGGACAGRREGTWEKHGREQTLIRICSGSGVIVLTQQWFVSLLSFMSVFIVTLFNTITLRSRDSHLYLMDTSRRLKFSVLSGLLSWCREDLEFEFMSVSLHSLFSCLLALFCLLKKK